MILKKNKQVNGNVIEEPNSNESEVKFPAASYLEQKKQLKEVNVVLMQQKFCIFTSLSVIL